MEFTSKESLIQALKNQIATRDNQALKALVSVFNNQTEDEQIADDVKVYNDMGFTPFDAEFMSSLAKQYLNKNYLSQKQLQYVKKIMPKYARQLIEQSIRDGKIVKNGKFYTWNKDTVTVKQPGKMTVTMKNIPSTDPENDWEEEWSDAPEKRWIAYKNEFAKLEAEQEAKAFLSKMEYESSLNR